jgi:kumamolisin
VARWRRTTALALAVALGGLAACGGGDGGGDPDPALPQSARVLVAFGLERDDAGLAEAVREASDPTSSSYGTFLTVDEVAERYGADAEDRDRVLDVLADAGAEGVVAATGGAVYAELSAEQVHDVLGTWPVAAEGGDGAQLAEVPTVLEVPDSMEGAVVEVVGARSTVTAGAAPEVPGTPVSEPCGSSVASGAGQPSPTGRWYGFDDALHRDDVRGQGRRIGILAIGRWEPATLDVLAGCYGTEPSGRIDVVPAPLTPDVEVGPEVTLDVLAASSFAPDAQIDVLQYDRHSSVAVALLHAFDAGADGERYDAVATSIGYCEGDLEAGERALADHALLALAAVGTTTVAASGDTGSAACAPAQEELAVQYPASSPWVTGIGGTTLVAGADGEIVDEVVWNDAAGTVLLAGGGGRSARYDAPWYQDGLDPDGDGASRMVPDVSFVADPGQLPPIPICDQADSCSWYQLGGTSAPAPAFAALLALVAQDVEGQAGGDGRSGLLNPLVRDLAEDSSDAVHDVTSGSNEVLGLGCCDAGDGYDLASGWGSLAVDELADEVVARRR